MPLGPYKNFDACVKAQQKKGKTLKEAKAICGFLYWRVEKARRRSRN